MTSLFRGVWSGVFWAIFCVSAWAGLLHAADPKSPEDFEFERVTSATSESQSRSGQKASPDNLEKTHIHVADRRGQELYKLYQSTIMSLAMIISLVVILAFVSKTKPSATHIIHVCALTLIIFGTMFIAVLADTDQQLTATTGILGAIAGYLFGTMRRGDDSPKEKPPPSAGITP